MSGRRGVELVFSAPGNAGPPPTGSPYMIRATWNGTVIAESDRTKKVEGNHYFPIEDINTGFLSDSPTHTRCPWKGKASYFTVVVNGKTNPDAAWTYPKPTFLARGIKGHVAFWNGIEVHEVDDPIPTRQPGTSDRDAS